MNFSNAIQPTSRQSDTGVVSRLASQKTGGNVNARSPNAAHSKRSRPTGSASSPLFTLAPELIKRNAIGYESASQLLITAEDNPQRLRSESGFAALCGVSPVPVSSGKTNRYRLNRGGDRAANSALHIIAIGRLRTDDKTKEYVARRVAEGHTKMEAIRCLKRYISREFYTLLRNQNKRVNSITIMA